MEFYDPPYMKQVKPTYTGLPTTIGYGAKFQLQITLPAGVTSVQGICLARPAHILSRPFLNHHFTVVLIDLGFATHAVHMVRPSLPLARLKHLLTMSR